MKWVADENFRNAILRGIVRHRPEFDVVRAQDIGRLSGKADLELLRFAAAEDRVVLTHDVSTMIPALQEQVRIDACSAHVVMVSDALPTALVIEEVLLLDACAVEEDWAAGVLYLPLR